MTATPRNPLLRLLLLSLLLLPAACSYNHPAEPATETPDDGGDDPAGYEDWTEATHGGSAAPDYDAVFPQDAVQRLDLVIAPDDWQTMLDDMTSRAGPFGAGGGFPGASTDDNPVWVPCSVFHDGTEWYEVGVRFKGNSSLNTAWRNGVMKLPLKLDFDQFEDDHPELLNQRFHGFKQLSLSSGFEDESLVREKVAADIFRSAGVPAARTAFCRIYIDHGDGPGYFGLYTLVEVIDDTMIADQFTADGGNLYKPDGTGARFAFGTFSEDDFVKKSNELELDWSDVETLFAALHAGTRTTDPAAWRAGLESILDVDAFLRWLAVNTVIQNWDTYGLMTHNYYLYNAPSTGRFVWIPWDNNEALQEGKMGGALPLDFTGVRSDWPLIRYLYDDADYRPRYADFVQAVIDGPFSSATMTPIYQSARALVEPYAVGPDGERDGYTFLSSSGAFAAAHADLIAHVSERNAAASTYLAGQP